jgi:hypothetical protein
MAINQETQNANGVHHARIDARNSATLAILTGVTCVAAFLVVYGGWGL